MAEDETHRRRYHKLSEATHCGHNDGDATVSILCSASAAPSRPCTLHSFLARRCAPTTQFVAAMWASNVSRLALLSCPNRAACACALSPSVSFLSQANLAANAGSWRRASSARLVRVAATADLESGTEAVEVEEPAKIDRVS